MARPAEAAANVGRNHFPFVYRSGFLFHRRLVSHLSGRERHISREWLDCHLDSLYRHGSWKLFWRLDVRSVDSTRLARRKSSQGDGSVWGHRYDLIDSDHIHDEPSSSNPAVCASNFLLWFVHDNR